MIIYDCEIVKAIQGKNEARKKGIEYCGGWKDFQGMGISCIGVYDYKENTYHVYCEDNLLEFQDLIDKRTWIVGFNSLSFDNLLCQANEITIPIEKSYDILVEVWKAAGLGSTFRFPTHTGYGLDALCNANAIRGKTGSGARAPILWQQGKIGQVIDYCLNDVKMTKELMDLILQEKCFMSPKHPWTVLEIKSPIFIT